MKKLKENKGISLIVFTVILAILVVIAGGVIVYLLKNPKKEKTEMKLANILPLNNEVQNIVTYVEDTGTTLEETNKQEKSPLKKDNSEELVYTQISKKSKNEYSFEIPYVNINSEYAEQINKEINKKYGDIKQLIQDSVNTPDSLKNVSYKSYVNKNILSLVIDNGEGFEYYVYNIDIYTGRKVTNNEILKEKNVSEGNFLKKVGDLSAEKAKNNNKDLSNDAIKDTRETNSNMKIKMFLDKQNNINIIPEIRTEAQYDPVEIIINTEL